MRSSRAQSTLLIGMTWKTFTLTESLTPSQRLAFSRVWVDSRNLYFLELFQWLLYRTERKLNKLLEAFNVDKTLCSTEEGQVGVIFILM